MIRLGSRFGNLVPDFAVLDTRFSRPTGDVCAPVALGGGGVRAMISRPTGDDCAPVALGGGGVWVDAWDCGGGGCAGL